MQDLLDIPALVALTGRFPPPQILDVRRAAIVQAHPRVIAGALTRDAETVLEWASRLEAWRPVAVYCAEGHERGRDTAATLRALGFDAHALEGGLAAWEAAGRPTVPLRPPSRWVTRARPRIDRIACPWLVRRFIDPAAEFHYVPANEVRAFAAEHGATPYDVPGVDYTHDGTACSFDAFIARHALRDPGLERLARIVRGADTGVLDLADEAPGLLAVSLGLSRVFAEDHAMLHAGLLLYDALYVRCRDAAVETAAA
jgi:rhodanese-related sulfurtransferase